MSPSRGAPFLAAALLAASLALPPLLLARAGGGGGFSGGGGGFSGGGGGFSGGYSGGSYGYSSRGRRKSSPAETLFIFAVVAVIYLIQALSRSSRNHEARVIAQGAAKASQKEIQDALARIKARDPAFSVPSFLDRVCRAFTNIQSAWSGQDMSPARAFLSDGVHERFAIYLEMQKAMGMRNKMSEARVLRADLVQVESDAHFDAVHVALHASAVDQDVSLETGEAIRNRRGEAEEFVEVWSFLRKPGAQTLEKPGLIEGFCPNCGAPIEINDAAKCASCGSWINSGEYDWILAEITQACVWRVREASIGVPGLETLKLRDPGLNVQFLEDRASAVFWRWQAAHWEAPGRSLAAVADPVFLEEFDKRQAGRKTLYRNAAVGSVEVAALEPGEDFDRAHVLVKWSGEHFEAEGGEPRSQGQALFHQIFQFVRRPGAATDARAGLRSLLCPSCGAPPSERSRPACEYCGLAFNDGGRTWTLVSVVPAATWKLPEVLAREDGTPVRRPAASPLDVLAVLVGAMAIDGKVEPREEAFAKDYARRHAIPPAKLDGLLSAMRAGKLDIPTPKDGKEAMAFLSAATRMCVADGTVSDRELASLLAFGGRMKLAEADVRHAVAKERAELYRLGRHGLDS